MKYLTLALLILTGCASQSPTLYREGPIVTQTWTHGTTNYTVKKDGLWMATLSWRTCITNTSDKAQPNFKISFKDITGKEIASDHKHGWIQPQEVTVQSGSIQITVEQLEAISSVEAYLDNSSD